jgi:hypothetical protein
LVEHQRHHEDHHPRRRKHTELLQRAGLNVDPAGAGDPGVAYYKLLIGHYSWVGDASGNTIEPLSGHGPLTDLLDYLFA